jgi:hypothetical protein
MNLSSVTGTTDLRSGMSGCSAGSGELVEFANSYAAFVEGASVRGSVAKPTAASVLDHSDALDLRTPFKILSRKR